MKVKIKPWLLKQMEVWLLYVKSHTARPNGDKNKEFRAKAIDDNDAVVINSQVKDAGLNTTEVQTIWDSL